MKIFTIGFTRKSAQQFFELLSSSGVERVVDVRLNNVSQLAGFAKRDDLEYFLRRVCGIDYVHLPSLAPTQEILAAYRKDHKDWSIYETQFLDLMRERRIEDSSPQRDRRRGMPPLQRGQAAPLPSAPRRPIPRRTLGRY